MVYAANKAIIMTLLLDGKTRSLKKLICRSEVDLAKCHLGSIDEGKNSHFVIIDKFIVIYEQCPLDFTDSDKKRRYSFTTYTVSV